MSRRVLFTIMMLLMVACLHAEQHTLRAEADRPGFGTGTNVLDRGMIQWETGFEVTHLTGTHIVTLPTTLFRFGLHERAEIRLEYTGDLIIEDHPIPAIKPDYYCEPLFVGTKLMLWDGSDEPKLRWIPRTSLMLNVGVPLTREEANRMRCHKRDRFLHRELQLFRL